MNAHLHDAYAAEYDRQVQAYGSHVHAALFGLCYEFLQPGQRLLDLGTGTGLLGELFARSGLVVHGLDFSLAMLALCQAKGFAVELIQQDLQQTPWPVSAASFEHIGCCGVFHFIADLGTIFAEAQRVLKANGLFAFTTKFPGAPLALQKKYTAADAGEMQIFSHAPEYIADLLNQTGFAQRKVMRCFVGEDIFTIWVAQ